MKIQFNFCLLWVLKIQSFFRVYFETCMHSVSGLMAPLLLSCFRQVPKTAILRAHQRLWCGHVEHRKPQRVPQNAIQIIGCISWWCWDSIKSTLFLYFPFFLIFLFPIFLFCFPFFSCFQISFSFFPNFFLIFPVFFSFFFLAVFRFFLFCSYWFFPIFPSLSSLFPVFLFSCFHNFLFFFISCFSSPFLSFVTPAF